MIARLYGKADDFSLVFEQRESGEWAAIVPPDLLDGKYIVELWAENLIGTVSYYTAVLYLCNSKCVQLEIMQENTFVEILPGRFVDKLLPGRHEVAVLCNRLLPPIVTERIACRHEICSR